MKNTLIMIVIGILSVGILGGSAIQMGLADEASDSMHDDDHDDYDTKYGDGHNNTHGDDYNDKHGDDYDTKYGDDYNDKHDDYDTKYDDQMHMFWSECLSKRDGTHAHTPNETRGIPGCSGEEIKQMLRECLDAVDADSPKLDCLLALRGMGAWMGMGDSRGAPAMADHCRGWGGHDCGPMSEWEHGRIMLKMLGHHAPFGMEPGTITVTGTASATIQPDILTITLGVDSVAETATEALAENSEALDAGIESLLALGMDEGQIRTAHLSIHPEYEWNEQLSRSVQVGYRVSNYITVSTDQLDLADDIIDETVAAGITGVQSVDYALSPGLAMDIRGDLASDAVHNAKMNAESVLDPLGQTILGVKSIQFVEPGASPVFAEYDSGIQYAKSTPVFAGVQQQTVSIAITFLIGPE